MGKSTTERVNKKKKTLTIVNRAILPQKKSFSRARTYIYEKNHINHSIFKSNTFIKTSKKGSEKYILMI